jgi:hypothetical protein
MAKSPRSTDVLSNLYDDLFSQQPDTFDHLLESSPFSAFSFLPDGDIPTQAGHGPATEAASSITGSGATTSLSGSGGTGYEWKGISFSSVEGYYYPPDNGLAANYSSTPLVVSAENGAIAATAFTDSTGVSYNQTIVSWTSFFSVKSGYSLSDPRVVFDGTHFIVGVDEIKPSAGSSFFAYEVSTTDHPSVTTQTDWSPTVHISTTEAGTWSDQPLLAVNGNYMYVTTNQFTSNGQYRGDYLTVVSDYAGTPSPTYFALDGPSYQPAVNSDGTSATELFVSHFNGSLHILSVNGASVGAEVTLGTADGVLPEYGSGSFSVGQAGTNNKLDAGDGRVTSAAYDATNHTLYAVFEIQPSSSSSTPAVELVQIDMASNHVVSAINLNNLVSSLTHTSGSTTGAATFNASVAVDSLGDVIANFNVGGSKMFADDVYALWKAPTGGGAPSLTAAPSALVDYQAGQGAYIDPGHDKVGRWGDYSTAVADPASASGGFWVSNEYDNGIVKIIGQSYGSWGTAIAHVSV